ARQAGWSGLAAPAESCSPCHPILIGRSSVRIRTRAPHLPSSAVWVAAPVRRIREMLPNSLLAGLARGCGTGRFSRLLHALLPDGSRLAASDVASATPGPAPPNSSGL